MIRVPWVAVVGGGMDTSTMAIGGRDSEVFTGRGSTCWCRITRVSLIRATRTAPCVAADGPWATGPGGVPPCASGLPGKVTTAARLRLVGPRAAAVVLLPFVPRWPRGRVAAERGQ
jgi:hypothetical protein